MPQINLTPEQKKDLESKGFAVKEAYDEISNRRSYRDPHKDEEGNVMGWTLPLPGDSLRMNYYLQKGFELKDPDGNTAPPPGYFRRRMPIIPTPKANGQVNKSVTHDEVPPKKDSVLRCPLCGQEFPDSETLIKHMLRHKKREKNKTEKGEKK
jgi:hypothetical protein